MRATVGVGRRLIAQLVAGRRQSRRKSGLSSQIILTRQPKTKPCMIIQHNRSPVSHYYEKKYTYHMPRSFGMETSSVTSIGTSGFWVQSSAAHALLLLKFQWNSFETNRLATRAWTGWDGLLYKLNPTCQKEGRYGAKYAWGAPFPALPLFRKAPTSFCHAARMHDSSSAPHAC